MSESNWGSPTPTPTGPDHKPAVPPAEPEPLFVYGNEPPYPVTVPNQNWGLNAPRWSYAVLVPRPSRPATVQAAVLLAYAGVGVAAAVSVSNGVYQWTNRDQIFSDVSTNTPSGSDAKSLVDASATLGLVIGALVWLLIAVGVVICAALASRKKNAARIVLAAGMAVVGLYNLCGVSTSVLLGSFGDRLAQRSGNSSLSLSLASAQIPWWATAGQGLLAAVALTIFVLLILPPSSRYYVAGAGRRFAPEA
jgi:hypothetical protein